VFADLGFENPHEEEFKAQLVEKIRTSMDALGLKQTEAARRMGISQPDLSKLLRGRVSGFSRDRMLDCLRALGNDIKISITPTSAEHGKMELELA